LKGEHVYNKLQQLKGPFIFDKLSIKFDHKKHKSIMDYNREKQNIYLKSDIYLQLSICEGFSYSMLDAFKCGNVIVATDVGLTYADVPDDCFVKLDYKKINDINYVINKLGEAWDNKDILSKNAINFYNKNCNEYDWDKKSII